MARGVGELVVTLALNAANYTAGLSKAERDAKAFTSRIRSSILEVGKVIGALAIGQVLFENTKEIIAQASALNDLADVTGSSVEALSKLSNQAQIAGVDAATLENALVKLSVGMADTSKEGSDAQQALKLLGISTRDPVQALQEAGAKLAGFEDGINKVGLAAALFGAKAGPRFLAALKDINELSDVNATVTKKQADEAEALEKAYRRLSVEATGFRNAILSDVVPAITEAIEEFREGIRIAGGFWEALRLGATLSPFESTANAITNLREKIAGLQSQAAKGRAFDWFNELPGEIADANKQLDILLARQRRETRGLFGQQFLDARDLRLQGGIAKPQAPGLPSKPDGKAAKEQISDAQKYIEALRRQAEGLIELTAHEKLLNDIRAGRVKFTQAEFLVAEGIAKQVDAFRDLEEWVKKSRDAWEAETKAAREAEEQHKKTVAAIDDETQGLKEANESLRDEIAIMLGGERARRAIVKLRADNAIAAVEQRIADVAAKEATQENADVLKSLNDQLEQLYENRELLDGQDFAAQMKREAEALQEVKNMFADTFADAFADFITGTKSAKDAFKSFVDDLTRQIARIASQNIANALFGGTNSGGPDFFGFLAKLLAGSATAGAGGGLNLSGYGPAFAAAGGTITGPTIVGERGPELFVPNGTGKVIPNNRMGDIGGATYNITVNVPKGADTASVRQATLRGVYAAQDAWRNR